jgi:protocatechuate 3,4-dioxygenase beta subunit
MDRRRAFWGAVAVLVLALGAAWLWLRRAPPPPLQQQAATEARRTAPGAAERAPPQLAERAPAPPRTGSAAAARKPEAGRARTEVGPAGGAVEGVVLSQATGGGIAGAELTFQRDEGASTVRTDPTGAFVFEPGRPGHYRVAAVAAEGYLPFAPAWGHSMLTVDLAAGQRVRGVVIFLSPANDYRVSVVDADDKGVPSAALRILGASTGELSLLPLPERATTDANGEATVRAPLGAVIEARREGLGSGRAPIDAAAEASGRVVIRLRTRGRPATFAERRLSGTVVDERGAPVGSALVIAHPRGRDDASPAGEAQTGPDGRFAIAGLDAVPYELEARADGYARAFQRVDSEATSVTLRLGKGVRLVGRVTDASTGQPVPSFTVQVWRRASPLMLDLVASRAFVEPAGTYELTDLAAGPALAVIAAPRYAPSEELPIELGEGTPGRADAALRPGARVRGHTIESDTRAPVAGARVRVEGRRGADSGPALATGTTTDEQGAFTLDGLAPGPLALFVNSDGHHARIVNVVVPQGADAPEVTVALNKLKPGEEPGIELAGVGAVLTAEGEALLLTRVLPGGGAAEAGLQPGDRVLTIDGRRVVELGFEGSMNTIRGPEGTSVVLGVQRGEASRADVRVWRRLIRG